MLSTKPDINAIVNFAFWPTQSDKLAACTHNNTDAEHSYLCTVDHYEACTLKTLGCVGGCKNDAKQLQLFKFLNCFEGKHVYPLEHPNATWLKDLEPCAKQASIDHQVIETCVNNVGKGGMLEEAWSSIRKFQQSISIMFFPWVTMGADPAKGAMMNGYDDCLLSALCGNFTSSPKPKSCVNMPKPPKGC